ncbi:serine hydrolase domain-containing protein [Kosmotoga arenicorallina]|uniref:serine hydrolase domain-containing protein n=1 Tax=Kosmotoga arenicorallina TaxID=688066 RepID=UPI0013726F9F|nr:serine hydrolase [Kosmotoga arenicorallina]
MILFLTSIAFGFIPDYWPTNSWKHDDSYSFDELESYIKRIFWKELHSLIIVKDGYVVYENYFKENGSQVSPDELHALYSATKSINSLLVGIMIDKGYISSEQIKITEIFSDYVFENPSKEKEEIEIRHVPENTCGFEWNEWAYSYSDPRNIYNKFVNSPDRVQFVLNLPMAHTPGEKFVYNTGASHLITAAIQRLTGKSALELAEENLFHPLGITEVIWSKDSQGINKGAGLNMIPEDMAKIGLLVLTEGIWEGKQLVPKSWIEKSLQKMHKVSTDVFFGYHWWIYEYKDIEIISAYGYNDQRIYIVPSKSLVVVTTAAISSEFSLTLLKDYILPKFE